MINSVDTKDLEATPEETTNPSAEPAEIESEEAGIDENGLM